MSVNQNKGMAKGSTVLVGIAPAFYSTVLEVEGSEVTVRLPECCDPRIITVPAEHVRVIED